MEVDYKGQEKAGILDFSWNFRPLLDSSKLRWIMYWLPGRDSNPRQGG